MKKIMMIVFLACGATGLRAQSMLRVRLADSSQFNLSVDGHYYNRRGTSITVGDLPSGNHHLTIFALRLDRWGRGHEEAVFEGKVKTHDGMITLFSYDYENDVTTMDEQDMNQYTLAHPPHRQGQHFRDQDNGGQGYDQNSGQGNGQNFDDRYRRNRYDNADDGNTGSYNRNNGDYGNQGNQGAPPQPAGTVTDNKMNDLKAAADAKPTDIDKESTLKDQLKNDKLTTAQVGKIMDWFIFESSKVDFAKWAYNNTVDKDNYTDLLNKFSFKASQDDLNQYISSQK